MLIFIIDWGSKTFAQAYLEPYTAIAILPFFNLTLAYNTGAAFSFLDTGTFWPNLLFGSIAIVVSIILLGWLYRTPRQKQMMNIALTLILGGALGNLWDRIHYQHVIDFIDFYVVNWHWPVFNFADAAVSIGALLVIWSWVRNE